MFGNNPTLRFPGNLLQVRSITELRGVSPYEMNDEAAILVTGSGLFTFDASSMANDDGVSVIRPNGFTPLQSGRWVQPAGAVSAADLAALEAQVAAGGVFTQTGDGAVTRSNLEKLRERVSVEDYRLLTDLDDTAAVERACAASRVVEFGPKQYRIANAKIPSFRYLRGCGKSPWEPYTGTDKPVGYLTEIIVNGTDAFDCRGTNSVTIEGMGFSSLTGKQSAYRTAPGFQASTGAVAITGSSQFQMRDVSFFGLEIAVHSHLTPGSLPGGGTVAGVETDEASNSANPTQMASISDWQASDCDVVFQFGNPASTAYTGRDVRICNEVVALHCNSIVRAHWCDGVRLEHLRFYQCVSNSILMRKCVFVTMSGVVVFETGADAVVLQECENVEAAGLMTGRTGFYAAPTGSLYAQRNAIVLDRCITTNITGIIEKPTGRAVDMTSCTTTTLNLSCDTPFWLTGNAASVSGAVNVTSSLATTVNASFGGAGHWVNVWADAASARSLVGSVTGHPSTGVTRAVKLQQQGGYIYRVPANVDISASGVLQFDTLRVFIPAGLKLMTRSVETTYNDVYLRANGMTWSSAATGEPGGGAIALDNKTLYDNTAGPDGYYSIPVSLINTSGATVSMQAGTEVRISTVLV